MAKAWEQLLDFYGENRWFCDVFLAENRTRVTRMVTDAVERTKTSNPTAVDIGCYNGYVSFLLGQFGFKCTGVDDLSLPDRETLLAKVGATFSRANLNHLSPFPELQSDRFDVAILGEVLEHILNHPLGFLKETARIVKPGGLLILTTPNPLTFSNAIRVLGGRSFVWGDREFVREIKMSRDGSIISHPEIHYREWSRELLLETLNEAGWEVVSHGYMPMDPARNQPVWKQWIKRAPMWRWMASKRWFGMTHYVVARKASSETRGRQ